MDYAYELNKVGINIIDSIFSCNCINRVIVDSTITLDFWVACRLFSGVPQSYKLASNERSRSNDNIEI